MAKAKRESRDNQKKKGEKMQAGTGPRPTSGTARIDPRIQREIGKHLRAHYDDLVKEPVPDKFIELLQQLEQSVAKKS
jgi:Anti-sigma factor NepR